MCKKQFVPACCCCPLPVACCLLAESWLAACLAGCLTACHFHGCFSACFPASLPGRHSKKAAMRSWRWIIALAAAKIVAYCWKCARRVSYLCRCHCSDCCWIGRNCKPLAARTCGDQDIGIACVFIILMKQLPLRKFTPIRVDAYNACVTFLYHLMRRNCF